MRRHCKGIPPGPLQLHSCSIHSQSTLPFFTTNSNRAGSPVCLLQGSSSDVITPKSRAALPPSNATSSLLGLRILLSPAALVSLYTRSFGTHSVHSLPLSPAPPNFCERLLCQQQSAAADNRATTFFTCPYSFLFPSKRTFSVARTEARASVAEEPSFGRKPTQGYSRDRTDSAIEESPGFLNLLCTLRVALWSGFSSLQCFCPRAPPHGCLLFLAIFSL